MPLFEIAITTSRGCTWPRLPCSVSVACRKVAGVPTGTERTRRIARDVLGLPDSSHMNPPAASECGANYLDGARDRREVQTAAQLAEFLERHVEKLADFTARIADRGLPWFRVSMRTRERNRFAVQVENLFTHIESGRKRAEPGDADRSGRVGKPADFFPRESQAQAREYSRQK